jgi:predicted N-acetyltransferase YhbS
LAQRVFGIDFEQWYQLGCWNDDYICYSFADGERIVANVSINKMKLLLDGRICHALQLATVMTDPEYRNRGLCRKLLETALAHHESAHEFTYLYANASVQDYYPRFGFAQKRLTRITAKAETAGFMRHPVRQLDIRNPRDWELIRKLTAERTAPSSRCAVLNGDNIFAWYCLNEFPQELYYLEDQEILVVCRKTGDTLLLLDVVSRRGVGISDFIGSFAEGDQVHIEFDFTPGFADIVPVAETLELRQTDLFFMKPSSALLPEGCRLPLTART